MSCQCAEPVETASVSNDDDGFEHLGDAPIDDVLRSILEHSAGLTLHHIFDGFDPMHGEVEDYWLGNVAERARGILSGRSSNDVSELMQLAEWMVEQRLEVAQVDYPKVYGPTNESLAHKLRRRQKFFKLENVEDATILTWPDIYAAIALAYVGRGLANGDSIEHMTAMEAVCTAETLRDQADIVDVEVAERIKASTVTAAKARAEKLFGPWKEMLKHFWDHGTYDTRAACARDLIKQHPEIIGTLPGEHIERTLVRWLSEHIKGGGRQPDEPPRAGDST